MPALTVCPSGEVYNPLRLIVALLQRLRRLHAMRLERQPAEVLDGLMACSMTIPDSSVCAE